MKMKKMLMAAVVLAGVVGYKKSVASAGSISISQSGANANLYTAGFFCDGILQSYSTNTTMFQISYLIAINFCSSSSSCCQTQGFNCSSPNASSTEISIPACPTGKSLTVQFTIGSSFNSPNFPTSSAQTIDPTKNYTWDGTNLTCTNCGTTGGSTAGSTGTTQSITIKNCGSNSMPGAFGIFDSTNSNPLSTYTPLTPNTPLAGNSSTTYTIPSSYSSSIKKLALSSASSPTTPSTNVTDPTTNDIFNIGSGNQFVVWQSQGTSGVYNAASGTTCPTACTPSTSAVTTACTCTTPSSVSPSGTSSTVPVGGYCCPSGYTASSSGCTAPCQATCNATTTSKCNYCPAGVTTAVACPSGTLCSATAIIGCQSGYTASPTTGTLISCTLCPSPNTVINGVCTPPSITVNVQNMVNGGYGLVYVACASGTKIYMNIGTGYSKTTSGYSSNGGLAPYGYSESNYPLASKAIFTIPSSCSQPSLVVEGAASSLYNNNTETNTCSNQEIAGNSTKWYSGAATITQTTISLPKPTATTLNLNLNNDANRCANLTSQ